MNKDTKEFLDFVSKMVNAINASNSTNDKIQFLSFYEDQEDIKKLLHYVYSPYIKFGVTSANVSKRLKDCQGVEFHGNLFDLLDALANRTLTGNNALDACNGFIHEYPEHTELILNILDKNLKMRMDAKNINKAIPGLIPEFSVSLCNVYKDRADKVDFENDTWYAARKLDGTRNLVIVNELGEVSCWSRQGKEFETLGKLKEEIASLGLRGVVFDGEVCIVDENGDEHFDLIMKEIKRKNHTIEHPMYQVFDMLTLDEFNKKAISPKFQDRYNAICTFFEEHDLKYMKPVKQTTVMSQEHFNELFSEAKAKGWEGLVIRRNIPYEGKRSNNMLKVKEFSDAEYIVKDAEFGPFRVIEGGKEIVENVLTNIIIEHKGNEVSVGSGFSLEQRRRYKQDPSKIIGKQVTVQYFEETKNKDGEYSLRFPVCKTVYEDGKRDC